MRESFVEARLNGSQEPGGTITDSPVTFGGAQDQFVARTRQRYIEEARFLDEMWVISCLVTLNHSWRWRCEVVPGLDRKTALYQSRKQDDWELKPFAAVD